jgi:hypothetical protein
VLLALLLGVFFVGGCRRSGVGAREVTLWVWERPEDLRAMDPSYGVAVLLLSVELHADQMAIRPRLQSLRLAGKHKTIGVVRIDANRNVQWTPEQRDIVVDRAARLPDQFSIESLQIDFDATLSQRVLYRDLLNDLRKKMRPDVPLSITALASWCVDDSWIRNLPIEEAVPMMFEMGPDRERIIQKLERGGDFSLDVCRKSVGLSTQEIVYRIPAGRRLFVFARRGWTNESLEAVAKLKDGL